MDNQEKKNDEYKKNLDEMQEQLDTYKNAVGLLTEEKGEYMNEIQKLKEKITILENQVTSNNSEPIISTISSTNNNSNDTSKYSSEAEKEINCTVIDVIDNNYTLTCRVKENIEHDLQSSISFIDEGIILINFDKVIQGNETNETIFYPQIETKGSRYYHYNKSRGLNVGSILAIIFALLAAILATGTIIVCFRKKSNHVENNQSTIYSLKSNN